MMEQTAEAGLEQTAEAARLARRESIKRIAATRELMVARTVDLNQQADGAKAHLDGLAVKHEADMRPLQTELEALTARIVESIVSGDAPDESDTQRRSEIFGEIDAANETLAAGIRSGRERLDCINRQLSRELGELMTLRASRNQLTHIGNANPELLSALFAAKQRAKYAALRVDEARQQHATAAAALESHERGRQQFDNRTIENLSRRVPKWTAELREATEDWQTAQQASEAAHRAVLDE